MAPRGRPCCYLLLVAEEVARNLAPAAVNLVGTIGQEIQILGSQEIQIFGSQETQILE